MRPCGSSVFPFFLFISFSLASVCGDDDGAHCSRNPGRCHNLKTGSKSIHDFVLACCGMRLRFNSGFVKRFDLTNYGELAALSLRQCPDMYGFDCQEELARNQASCAQGTT